MIRAQALNLPPTATSLAIVACLATALLPFVGPPQTAVLPVVAAVAVVILAPQPRSQARRLAVVLAAITLLLLGFGAGAVIHPWQGGIIVFGTLLASCSSAVAVASLRSRWAIPVGVGLASLSSLALAIASLILAPERLDRKSILVGVIRHLPQIHNLPKVLDSVNPNESAVLGCIAGAAAVAAALLPEARRGTRAAWFGVAGLLVAVLLLDGSRTGYIATVGGVGVAVSMRLWPASAKGLLSSGVIAVGALAVGLTASLQDPRWDIWVGSVEAVSNDWITGTGPGSFPFVFGSEIDLPQGAHQTLLETWIVGGSLGTAGVILLVSYGLWRSWTGRATSTGSVMFPTLIAWCISSMFESTVVVTTRSEVPWHGWKEEVVPLLFVLVGLTLTRSARPRDGG